MKWPWWWWRTQTALALRGELQRLQIDIASLSKDVPGRQWLVEAEALVAEAEKVLDARAWDRFAVHEAWGWVLGARRRLIHGLDAGELEGEITILEKEVEHDLSGWRRAAARDLVTATREHQEATGTLRRDLVERAMRIRDEHTQILYRDALAISSRTRTLTLLTLIVVAALVVTLSANDLAGVDVTRTPTPLLVLLFGLLGGSISAFAPIARPTRRYADQWSRWFLTLARPFIGGAAAVALYPLVLGGFLPSESESFPALAALSVAAGFSERVLWRAVAAAGAPDPADREREAGPGAALGTDPASVNKRPGR